ncbi:hypothetical protein D9M71_665740 [compost metagenome]
MKYRSYSAVAMKTKATTPMTRTARLMSIARMRPNHPSPECPLFLRGAPKLSRCRVLSSSPTLTSSPERCAEIRWRRVMMSRGLRLWNWQPTRLLTASTERTWNSTRMTSARSSMAKVSSPLW